MNPFDAVGTARISSAIYDRICRIAMGYQPEHEEVAIVEREAPNADPCSRRAWRELLDCRERIQRFGSARRYAAPSISYFSAGDWRSSALPATDFDVGLDAALTALGGRIQLHDGNQADSEQIVRDLWAAACREVDEAREGDRGKA